MPQRESHWKEKHPLSKHALLFYSSPQQWGCYIKCGRVIDPGRRSAQADIRMETDGTQRDTPTASPLSLFFHLRGMESRRCMLQVAKEHTGERDMHLFFLLGRLIIAQRLFSSKKTSSGSATLNKPPVPSLVTERLHFDMLLFNVLHHFWRKDCWKGKYHHILKKKC